MNDILAIYDIIPWGHKGPGYYNAGITFKVRYSNGQQEEYTMYFDEFENPESNLALKIAIMCSDSLLAEIKNNKEFNKKIINRRH